MSPRAEGGPSAPAAARTSTSTFEKDSTLVGSSRPRKVLFKERTRASSDSSRLASAAPPGNLRCPRAAVKALAAAARHSSTTSGSLSAQAAVSAMTSRSRMATSVVPAFRFILGSSPHPFLHPFVSPNDAGHERVADDIGLGEMNEGDAGDALQYLDCVSQARAGSLRQIDLAQVAGDDHAGVFAQSRKKHLHLHGRRILCFVENDESIRQRAPAHEGEGSNLYLAIVQPLDDLRRRQHVIERVVERTQVGVDLFPHVAGQETQLLAGLHGRA